METPLGASIRTMYGAVGSRILNVLVTGPGLAGSRTYWKGPNATNVPAAAVDARLASAAPQNNTFPTDFSKDIEAALSLPYRV